MNKDAVPSGMQNSGKESIDMEKSVVLDLESLEQVLGMAFAQVVRNTCVLTAAQNYLRLRADLSGEAEHRSVVNSFSLPSDLAQVERGVGILCAAYVQGAQSSDTDVCADVEKEVGALSGFYQKQVAEAYVSACNIVFDASEAANRPDLMKQLVTCRDALQQMHCAWPTDKDESNMPRFNEKVDMYGRQLGIEGRVFPAFKGTFNTGLPSSAFISAYANERCA